MFMKNRKSFMNYLSSHAGNQRGQSLIIALLVMFLLIFIAAIFVSMLARNIGRTQRSGETQNADYLAEAGVNFADEQLTYSPDGADWRPTPQFPRVVMAMYDPTIVLQPNEKPNPSDPDYTWLMEGYSRYTYGKGRFLLRVTYNPINDDPLSKYIKIESIGRMGVVDQRDPTSWTAQPERLRSERVAYKAIGITDYARYITNKDRRGDEINLGTPGYVTNFGDLKNPANNGQLLPADVDGAPIRVNGDLAWYGTNYIYLNADRGDGVEVSGDIRNANTAREDLTIPDTATEVRLNRNYVAQESGAVDTVTGKTLFSTFPLMKSDGTTSDVGSYRDGRPEGDSNNPNPLPRSISRLDPPVVDTVGPAGGLGRYRDLTRNSGEWLQDANGNWFNTGYYGWGEGIYLDNKLDIQLESSMYTLKGNWSKPGSQYWNGPYYTPPGINIYLMDRDINNDNIPDMIITHDNGPGQPIYNWFDANGNLIPSAGERMVMPYPKNGVIFAEGNVRIRGKLPPPAVVGGPQYSNQLTVVSAGTIYIDGNILKYDKDGQGIRTNQKDSAISLLARDNICVNTTQFFAPSNEVLSAGSGGDYFEVTPDKAFWMNFAFGDDGVDLVDGSGRALYGTDIPVNLYVRHTSPIDYGMSYINMLINYPPSDADKQADLYASIYKFTNNNPATPQDYIYSLGNASANQKEPGWEYAVFPLITNGNTYNNASYRYYPDPGAYNSIAFQLDQSVTQNTGALNYYISRAAVMPGEIRIEALMYAQNGSFYVLPGEWFNPDPNDTRAAYDAMPAAQRARPIGVNDEWPFYGEPIDVRVTVYGAVSENLPAPVGDTIDWMEKWGWIPDQHGSAGVDTKTYRYPIHPGNTNDVVRQGLTFIYDPMLSNPKLNPAPGQYQPIRKDEFNRPLPVTPKLPVSTSLLFMGQAV